MNILLVFEDLEMGGGQKYGVELANYLQKNNDVSVYLTYGSEKIFWKELDRDIIKYKFKIDKRASFLYQIKNLNLVRWFYKILKAEQIDVVHFFSFRAPFYASLAAKLLNIPTIYTPMSVEARGVLQRLQYAKHGVVFKFLDSLITKYIGLSDFLSNEYIQVRGVSAIKVETVWLGVDLKKYYTIETKIEGRYQKNLSSDEFLIVTVGRLNKLKRIYKLVDAFAYFLEKYKIEDIRFLIIGDGEDKGKLAKQSMKLSIQNRITFLGASSEVNEILPLLDLFVFATVNPNLGLAVQEAMASGLPLLVLGEKEDYRQMAKDCCINEYNGFVPISIEDMADKIYWLYLNREKSKEFGANSRKRAEELFDITKHHSKMLDIYQALKTRKVEN